MRLALFHKLHETQPLTFTRATRISKGWYSLRWWNFTLEVETSDALDAKLVGLLKLNPGD